MAKNRPAAHTYALEREENVTGIHARYVVLLTMWKDTT